MRWFLVLRNGFDRRLSGIPCMILDMDLNDDLCMWMTSPYLSGKRKMPFPKIWDLWHEIWKQIWIFKRPKNLLRIYRWCVPNMGDQLLWYLYILEFSPLDCCLKSHLGKAWFAPSFQDNYRKKMDMKPWASHIPWS